MFNIKQLLVENLNGFNLKKTYPIDNNLTFYITRNYSTNGEEEQFLNTLDELVNKECIGISYTIEVSTHTIDLAIYSNRTGSLYKKSFKSDQITYEQLKLCTV